MAYTEEILKKVKVFGALQYTPEKMATILQIEEKERFFNDLLDEDSILFAVYQSGLQSGQYSQDIQLFRESEVQIKLSQLEYDQVNMESKVYKELFGL